MKITLLGAAGIVTGSSYLVQTPNGCLLIDFGVFQGERESMEINIVPKQLKPAKLSAVLLTHGHLDHVGRLPLLVMSGFHGPIHGTPATLEMAALVLKDSAKVQEQDIKRINRKRERAGEELLKPMFEMEDVEATVKLFRPIDYKTRVQIAPDLSARFAEAGHMLGSTSILVTSEENGVKKTAVFSGDLGPANLPIMKDFEPFEKADAVFMESTYGDRDHKSAEETKKEAYKAINGALLRKGKIIVPAFAIGRTQQILYEMAKAFIAGELSRFPIYIDSPMAIAANELYTRHVELMDEEATRLLKDPRFVEEIKRFTPCESAEESKLLNTKAGPFMVLAGSGMCTAGRILHHLKQNLWKKETLVMIVGYQGVGTLGRKLVEGATDVFIFGEKIQVNAQIVTLGGYSAHAGQSDLVRWITPAIKNNCRVILTHGESKGRKPLARLLTEKFGIKPEMPEMFDTIEV